MNGADVIVCATIGIVSWKRNVLGIAIEIALKLINLIVIVSCIAMVVCLFEEMTAGSLSFVEFIGNALIVLAVYKLFRSRFCQSLPEEASIRGRFL